MPDSTDLDRHADLNDGPLTGAHPRASRSRRLWRVIRILGVLLIGAAGAGAAALEVHDRLTNIHEVDARISADVITISSKVNGLITSIARREGDDVEAGSLMFTIDAQGSQFRIQEMEAQLAGLQAEVEQKVAERQLVSKQLASRRKSVVSLLEAAQVGVSSLEPQLKLARREFERAESLYEKRVVSRRQRDQAEQELEEVQREYRIAVADFNAAEARLLEADAEGARLGVLDKELSVYGHRQAELGARLGEQRLDLKDRTVQVPINGVVDRIFIKRGEYITAGQRLALVHDPNKVWIDANIKETQIRKVDVGDRVDVVVDAFPDRLFEGRVENIGNTTTAEFALLPSPNPSGNFTKITQRLPVRIAIDQEGKMLRPGMLVEIKIDADQNAVGMPFSLSEFFQTLFAKISQADAG